MSGLYPQNGATNQSQSPIIRIEFCGMTELELNYFNLKDQTDAVITDVTTAKGAYWATITPNFNLTNGSTYSLEVDGRINDNGTVKQIAAGTWAFSVRDITDPGVLYSEDFSGTSFSIPHTLTAEEAEDEFVWTNVLPAVGGTMHLVNDPAASNRGTVLRVDFAEGNYGFGVPIPGYTAQPNGMRAQIWSDAGRDELYFAYDIYFPDDFVFPLTMRGPALWGGEFHETTDSADYGKRVAAEIRNHGANADAAQINYQYVCGQNNSIDGEMSFYSYDSTQSQFSEKIGTEYKKGEWNRIEFYVLINDPVTSSNGKLYCWLNGQLIGTNNAKHWISSVDSGLQFETAQLFFGGNSSCWVSPKTQSLYIDNLIISENPIHEVTTDEIKIYSTNPWYWEYKGQPTLLLGGDAHNALFQVANLQSHLNELQSAGINYVRNTMTQRLLWNLPGNLDFAYASSGGTFNLDQWNPSYWDDLANLFMWADERDIIIQLELWDRWDFTGTSWSDNPFRPANNSNYTTSSSGLSDSSTAPDINNKFFRTVPAMENNTVVLPYQQAFVDEVLNHAFQYKNILYCVGNESEADEDWGTYWSTYMKDAATAAGVSIETTQMMDDWTMNSSQQKLVFDHPETYSYVDISQNTQYNGLTHWNGVQYVRNYIAAAPRPINNVKIYTKGTTAQAVEKLWRNIIGGCASSRFHRGPGSLGYSQPAKNAISAARKMLTKVNMWEMTPQQGLLSDNSTEEAYLSAEAGIQYALFFRDGGSVEIDFSLYSGDTFNLDWINIDTGAWGSSSAFIGGLPRTISAPSSGPWVVTIVKQ